MRKKSLIIMIFVMCFLLEGCGLSNKTDKERAKEVVISFLDVEEGLARIAKNQEREVNRLDLEGLELHQKVRQGYLALYEKEPERIVKIDASQSFEAVFADVLAVLENRLGILK